MRYHVTSAARPKAIARALKAALTHQGHALSYSACLERVAAMYGYRNWRELESEIGAAASDPDEAASEEVVAARRAQHLRALDDLGLAEDLAGLLIDFIGPTRRRRAMPGGETNITLEMPIPRRRGDILIGERLIAAAAWVSGSGRRVRLDVDPTDPGIAILSWAVENPRWRDPDEFDFTLDLDADPPEPRDLGYFIAFRGPVLRIGRFPGDLPPRALTYADLPEQEVGGTAMSDALHALGYGKTVARDAIDRARATPLARFLGRLDHDALWMLRACRHFSLEDYGAVAALPDTPAGLRSLLRTTPVLTSLITHCSGRAPWPIGLAHELREVEDARAHLCAIFSDAECSADEIRRGLDRCREWTPTPQNPGFCLEALRLLSHCPADALPEGDGEIDGLVSLGEKLAAQRLDGATLASVLAKTPWTNWRAQARWDWPLGEPELMGWKIGGVSVGEATEDGETPAHVIAMQMEISGPLS